MADSARHSFKFSAPVRKNCQAKGQALLSARAWELVGEELGLSRRQLELVRHVFDGKKLTTVASEMRLSLGTVKTYSQRIHQKLEIRDQRELALAVFGAYLRIPPEERPR